ncbi:MAG: ABC transporter ATP-binding protein [Oscillospiraceae bacterium]|nr:ABC transporter ATP-binding protein [Oscillospiraceae bacterium]
MLKLMLKYKWYLCAIIGLMIAEPTINSALNFWLQRLFNSATVGADTVFIFRLLTGGFLLWMTKRLVTHTMLILRDRYICNMKSDVKHQMFVKLLSVNTANLSASGSSGEFISMFTNDILLLEQRFFNQIMGLISGIFSIVILGWSFVALNAKLAAAIILFGFSTMLIPIFFSRLLNGKNLEYTRKIGKFTQRLKEYLVAYPTIKNYSVENSVGDIFAKLNNETEDAKFDADCAITLANSIGQLSAWFMQFIGVGLGIMLVIRGEILIGTVIAAQSFASDLALPIQNIIININSIRSVKNIIQKLENLASEYSSAQQPAKWQEQPPAAQHGNEIAFRNLHLTVGDVTIIDDFSFTFESGKKYLIVGQNGAGKSSIFKTLKKWHRSCSGDVTIGGKNVLDFTNEELSRTVSYLNEHVTILSGSVRDNILLFRSCDAAELDQAVADSHIELDLSKELNDEGQNISSGEQRRIEIARALLKSAPILIFDEVVSTLDIETAYDVEKSALGLEDKTVIFISHNFSGKLIECYDEILVMNAGRLEAAGTYRELLESSPYFRRICEIKFGHTEK